MAQVRYKNTNEPVIAEQMPGEKPKTAVALAYEPGETAPKIIAAGKGVIAEKLLKRQRNRKSPFIGMISWQIPCQSWKLEQTFRRNYTKWWQKYWCLWMIWIN